MDIASRHDRRGCCLVDDGRQLVVAVLGRLDAIVAAGYRLSRSRSFRVSRSSM
jgi:hypothetical protein